MSSFSYASPSKPNWVIIPTSFTKTKEEYAIGFIVTCVCLILTFVALLIMLALYLYVIKHSREYAHKKKETQIEEAVRQYMSNKNYDVHRETDSEQSYEKKIKKSEKRISKKSTCEVGFKLKCFVCVIIKYVSCKICRTTSIDAILPRYLHLLFASLKPKIDWNNKMLTLFR